ncbi:NAD(+) kinase [Malassezia brasiliensis]|uniref:NAD(+) kinase n=1 Tax=Malassezia brasiliensis TaxID=1821822 RepID=A0AAF0DRL9_9BASI|nr:NAD(+) kinase [Malassezia brasiliensis]
MSINKPEAMQYSPSMLPTSPTSDADEELDGRMRSITNQLAETAVGVREMSKQLVRARVHSDVETVLIITKARDNRLVELTREMAIWLMTTRINDKGRGITVYVDSQLRYSKRFNVDKIREEHPEVFEPIHPHQQGTMRPRSRSQSRSQSPHRFMHHEPPSQEGQLRFWTAELCSSSPHLFDFVITLGGDGTVLFCSWLFQNSVPPVVPFSLGSLGFLTPFNFDDYKSSLTNVLKKGMRLSASRYLRKAIKSSDTGEIIMRNIQEDGWNAIEVGPTARDTTNEHSSNKPQKDKPVRCFGTRPVETFEILNDLVVDRGPSPFVSMLEVFADNNHLTTAQADGLCVSTPTGSTAYSLSAGGSLVYPDIPAILMTPICPHTLSFRPMLLPDSMELRIAVPYHSRSNAWASFDGRGRIEIKRGDHIKVTASPYPFPAVCPEDQPYPWFDSVSRTLNWNQRQKQKSFVMVEEHVPGTDSNGKPTSGSSEQRNTAQGQSTETEVPERPRSEPSRSIDSLSSDDSDFDSESEEEYDIDDQSTAPVSRSSTFDRTLSEPSGSLPSVAAAMRREVFSSAIVVYGHDDTDDSESSEA